jgi:starch synthase
VAVRTKQASLDIVSDRLSCLTSFQRQASNLLPAAMKVTLNTTTRPVGFDYARALEEAGGLENFVCAFPKRKSADLAALLGPRAVFCDLWQMVFLVTNRLAGSSAVSRALSHHAKVKLDRATAKNLGGCDAAVFYSGAGLATVRECRRRGILSVSQVHHAHVLEQERILKAEAAACGLPYTPIYSPAQVRRQLAEFEQCDVIVCPSGAVKESFERAGVLPQRLVVVPHGVALTGTEVTTTRSANGPMRVLYVGQLHFRKGLRYLAGAARDLDSDNFHFRLVGPDFGLSGLENVEGAECLMRVGPLKGEDLARAYREADVLVLPSVEEGFGLVVLEAMLAGLPVIITSAVGAKDLVIDGTEGWIIPPGDAAALQKKLIWMRHHPAERLAMGEAAESRARTAGGWGASARNLLTLLKDRVTQNPSVRRR